MSTRSRRREPGAQLLYRSELFDLLLRTGDADSGPMGLAGPQDGRAADILNHILEYAVVAGAS